MKQATLFADDARESKIFIHDDGSKSRNYNGWFQGCGRDGVWKYCVTGFYERFYCAVKRWEGQDQVCPIDHRNRVTIDGIRVGETRWTH